MYARPVRDQLHLTDFTVGVPSYKIRSWEGDVIEDPIPPGIGSTTYLVVGGRVELKVAGGNCTGWWLQVMAYTYAWSLPLPAPQASPPRTEGPPPSNPTPGDPPSPTSLAGCALHGHPRQEGPTL